MLRARDICVLCCVGCGRIGFSPATVDSGFAVATGPFGPATVIAALSDPAPDDDPAVSSDGLELYFASKRATGVDNDIWFSIRNTRSESWPAPTIVDAVSTPGDERSPALSSDGLTLWLDRGGDLFVATRAAVGAPWSTPMSVTELDPPESIGTPATCDNERRLFVRIASATNGTELAVTTRTDASALWAPPAFVTELNTPLDDGGPHPSWDCRRLYFHSDRTGQGLLYTSELDDLLGVYGAPSPIMLESPRGTDPSLTIDESYLVFSVTVAGNEEIVEALR